MPGKNLLELDDDILRHIGTILGDIGRSLEPLPFMFEQANEEALPAPQNLLAFTATCRKLRDLIVLDDLVFRFGTKVTKGHIDSYERHRWIAKIPPRLKRGIR